MESLLLFYFGVFPSNIFMRKLEKKCFKFQIVLISIIYQIVLDTSLLNIIKSKTTVHTYMVTFSIINKTVVVYTFI
jgi:hypothetical protein